MLLLQQFVFADEASRSKYMREKNMWIDAHQRDAHNDFSCGMKIQGFQGRMMASGDNRPVPCWIHFGWYVVTIFVPLNWFYRVLIESVCGRTKVTFVKQVRG